MKRMILSVALLVFIFTSCKKSHEEVKCPYVMGVPSAGEIALLKNYLDSKGLSAIQHPGGFFYQIVTSGFGDVPKLSDSVQVSYTGMLADGTVFDATAAGQKRKFLLSDLILGWQAGLPLIRSGGEINLYLPPSLGYGCNSAGIIPAGVRLIFNIKLYGY